MDKRFLIIVPLLLLGALILAGPSLAAQGAAAGTGSGAQGSEICQLVDQFQPATTYYGRGGYREVLPGRTVKVTK